MDKFFKIVALFAIAASCMAACTEEERNTEPLVDPWLREKTPVNFRLENQIGAANITSNWRDDSVGGIHVSMITGGLDMTKVKVVALDFEFPESEFCPTASVKAGDCIDLSSGSATFTVTSYNGEVRTYTVDYEQFKDPLEGVYVHEKIKGILDNGTMSSMVILGGWTDAVVMSTDQDKSWHWGSGYQPLDEQDNQISFLLTSADSETGITRGTIVNNPGDDGKYANYVYNNSIDVNRYYRQIPVGASRWEKTLDGKIHIYAKDDVDYSNELWTVNLDNLEKINAENNALNLVRENPITIDFQSAKMSFWRDCGFDPANEVINLSWPDTRWMADNIRYTFWTVAKSSDDALENHEELFEQL